MTICSQMMTDRGLISRQNSGILAQVQVKQRIGVVVA